MCTSIRISLIRTFLGVILLLGCREEEPGMLLPFLSVTLEEDYLNTSVGETVTLAGDIFVSTQAASLNYKWSFDSKPQGSSTEILNDDQPIATFQPDIPGKYLARLTISDDASYGSGLLTVSAFSVNQLAGTFSTITPGPDAKIEVFAVYNNKLFAAGEFLEIGGVAANRIASYDGSTWVPLGSGLRKGKIYDMITYADELYVTGEFEKIGSISAKNIARWDGDHWKPVSSGIGSGMGEVGYVLEVFEDHLYIGGYFSNAGELTAGSLAKWNGKAFVSTPGFQEAIIRALKVYKSELFVGGDFDWWYNGVEFLTTLGGTQWFSTGYDRVYRNLDSGGTGYVWDMEVFQDVLYISGGTEFGRYTELVAFDGTQFKEFGRAFSLHPENVIYTLEVAEEGLYIGGAFHNAVGTEANGILKWDGNQWNILTEGVDGAVFSLQSFQNQLYIGGNFDMAGGQPAGNIAAWTE